MIYLCSQKKLSFRRGCKVEVRFLQVSLGVCEKLKAEHSNRVGVGEEVKVRAESRGRGGAAFTAGNTPILGMLTGRDLIWGVGC